MASEVVRDGCLAVNKPRGMSSAQVIRECQDSWSASNFFKPVIEAEVNKRKQEGNLRKKHMRRAQQLKVGHGGTLDPLATGILILGIGSATKSLAQFLNCYKTYEATVIFGASSDTYDRVGRILTQRPYDHITKDKVEEAVKSFQGKQMQIPPLYSALKMDGKPLYEYAREGKPIPREIQGREVEIKEIELVEYYEPGSHDHRWPTEVAEAAERNLAEQVWRVKKTQETGRKLTPEEKEEDDLAIAAHETFKRKFEERQDALISDSPSKRSRQGKEPPMMSGALGKLPEASASAPESESTSNGKGKGKGKNKGGREDRKKGADLIPEELNKVHPAPWKDQGPPACKIRMTVSSGFYVRSLCHDLGTKLDSAALMAELARTRQSDFTLDGFNCLEYEDIAKGEDQWGPKVSDMLARWNGEPVNDYKPPTPPPKKVEQPSVSERVAAQGEAIVNKAEKELEKESGESTQHQVNQAEKRKLSPSPDGDSLAPPRKAQATGKGRNDDEKSWSGIED